MKKLFPLCCLIFILSCNSDEPIMTINPVQAFIGEWHLTQQQIDGVVSNYEGDILTITDSEILDDNKAKATMFYSSTNATDDDMEFILVSDEGRLEIRGNITWLCDYKFTNDNEVILSEEWPNGEVMENTWTRQ